MGTYAVTGSASGMGAATARRLRADGHTVIGVDIREAEVVADLSTRAGRAQAATDVLAAAEGRLDGAVLAAGLGPGPGAERLRRIAEVNYLGVVELLDRWRPGLAATYGAKVVVLSSNSTTTTPLVPRRVVRALIAGDVDKALRGIRVFGPARPAIIYAASKIAVSRWVRRHAVRPEWAGAGIRLNALLRVRCARPCSRSSWPAPGRVERCVASPFRSAASETPTNSPNGCASCCLMQPISFAAV